MGRGLSFILKRVGREGGVFSGWVYLVFFLEVFEDKFNRSLSFEFGLLEFLSG